jgi:hypothetical protein
MSCTLTSFSEDLESTVRKDVPRRSSYWSSESIERELRILKN